MKYETIKSFVLIILVLISILLTWNLWTYQPKYATMEKNNYVAEVTLSEKQEIKKIIKPDVVLFHQKGVHYGAIDPDELDKLLKELSRWNFYNVQNYTDKAGDLNQLMHGNGNVEIIFPTEVPVELYRNVLNFEEKKIPSFNFDRIIINVEDTSKDNGIVYFVSTANQQVYISNISAALLNDFNRNFYRNVTQNLHYSRYFAYNATEKRTIFLPENTTTMTEYKYIPSMLNSNELKDALFTDPSFVQKSVVTSGEEYTNGSSKMNINNDKNMLLYVNPTAEGNYTEKPSDLVQRSIDFVNEHGGWTDQFRYVDKDEAHHRVTFRLYNEEGYPVFSKDGLSEIKETWGKNDINKYARPDISLELPLKTEMQKVTLPSGHEVLRYIQSKKNFKPELLENVVLGYEMEKDTEESKLILLKPAWLYRYNKVWYQVPLDEMGGNE